MHVCLRFCWETLPNFERKQKGGFVGGWFWRMYSTLIPVFGTGEHPHVPSFRLWVPGSIPMYPCSGYWYRGTSAKATLLETTLCEPPKITLQIKFRMTIFKVFTKHYLRLCLLQRLFLFLWFLKVLLPDPSTQALNDVRLLLLSWGYFLACKSLSKKLPYCRRRKTLRIHPKVVEEIISGILHIFADLSLIRINFRNM